MRFSSRRSDADADVIRARLRALLEDRPVGGWVPDADDEPIEGEPPWTAGSALRTPLGAAGSFPDEEEAPYSADLPPGIGRHRAPGRAARWDPGRGGARSLWIAGLLAALLLAGWTWLDRPRVEAVLPAPAGATAGAATKAATPTVGEAAGTSAVVVVSVVGLVVRPGLVTLPAGARVADAVQAAGGLLPEADPASVNLAALVADGAQISVGVPGSAPGPGSGSAGAPGSGGRVDLNTATAGDLDALPGIGPVLAQRIVDHRTRNGPFRSVDQLDDVPGIGPATAAELAELVGV
ncbi:ComEA family DNA-binding protein [Blastococcus sp. CT_GayMR19]|uniref:ComEA family DNA-binding protein n=1 Tax=Blastococcus sp. CT_GayMR19 TaxID=2559608 RepID=UPI001073564B|nr:ComEA family DNA-binding protein [Blastococcus sp. CT_GayMR19]TFV79480.1 ComEA family DNA-binding protein [Blastococcus sp. CT_GayMR19]